MQKYTTYLLLIIIIVGGLMRLYNYNWDQDYIFNPDEYSNIALPAANLTPPFHPERFTYGALTIYLYRMIAQLFAFIFSDSSYLEIDTINNIGRIISAILSTIVIYLTYYLGKRIFNINIGILAAFFTSFNVGLIQAAHFSTTETILTLTSILTTLLAINLIKNKKDYFYTILQSLNIGISCAAKVSGLIFFPINIIAIVLSINKNNYLKILLLIITYTILSLLIFITLHPYSFIDYKSFSESFMIEKSVATGKIPVFYTIQFKDTIPYLFQAIQIFPYTTGFPVSILALIGLILTIYRFINKPSKDIFILLLTPTLYFLYYGSLYVKWTRYLIPLLPFSSLFAAYILIYLYQKATIINKKISIILIACIMTLQFLHSFSYLSIYIHEDTRIQASKWIYQNIPPQSTLLLEPNDVAVLPLNLTNKTNSIYHQNIYDFYSLDSTDENTLLLLSENIGKSDYIIIGSRRVYANHLRLPTTYPNTTTYYKLLLSESLGYTKIKEISSYPRLLNLTFNDDSSEETFQVFDHPKILIYKNTGRFNSTTIYNLLNNNI